MSNVDRNKATAQKFFDRVFNHGDMTALASLAPGYTFDGQPQSNPQFIGWVNGMRTAMPDLHFAIEDILGEGDKIALRWRMNGTTAGGASTPGGVKVETTGTNIMTFNAEGLCVSNYQNGYGAFTMGGQTVRKTDQAIYSPPAAPAQA